MVVIQRDTDKLEVQAHKNLIKFNKALHLGWNNPKQQYDVGVDYAAALRRKKKKKRERLKKSEGLRRQHHTFSLLARKVNCILGYTSKNIASWSKETTIFLLIALLRPYLE